MSWEYQKGLPESTGLYGTELPLEPPLPADTHCPDPKDDRGVLIAGAGQWWRRRVDYCSLAAKRRKPHRARTGGGTDHDVAPLEEKEISTKLGRDRKRGPEGRCSLVQPI